MRVKKTRSSFGKDYRSDWLRLGSGSGVGFREWGGGRMSRGGVGVGDHGSRLGRVDSCRRFDSGVGWKVLRGERAFAFFDVGVSEEAEDRARWCVSSVRGGLLRRWRRLVEPGWWGAAPLMQGMSVRCHGSRMMGCDRVARGGSSSEGVGECQRRCAASGVARLWVAVVPRQAIRPVLPET